MELTGCAGGEVGRLHGRGINVSDPDRGNGLWLAAALSAAASREVARGVALFIDLGLVVPLIRSTFVLLNVGPVHTPAAAVGRGSIGAEVRFF